MELRDFAEQVLFATTLEEKLQCPAIITDERPGLALATPEAPGRPAALKFKPQGSGKAEFPGTHRLEHAAERGRLLHLFANHELLATELMALVLLRFPDAPAAFRRGVLQTLRDEQEHTRLYVARMAECGIEFGDLSVSGYFWRAVSGMESPMDYVAGLSLTFEQANLDFARHFAQGFATVGDEATAGLLQKIYRDEIGHVAYGLKWFRRWKNPTESDWDAFCRQLKFPLSPQRAKGFSVNAEGRRAAGLDPGFIAELDIFSQSKGRTPGVFVFNPFAEGFIAHGPHFTPAKHQAQLARDLANLPQFLCRQDDLVLVPERPAVEFLSGLKQAGFPLSEFVEMGKPLTRPSDTLSPRRTRGEGGVRGSLVNRKLGSLRPWAWGPDSVALLASLFPTVTGETRRPDECFNAGIAQLYSKAWSAEFLRQFLNRSSRREEALTSHSAFRTPHSAFDQSLVTSAATESWLCTLNEVGVAVSTLDDALATIAAIRARGHHKIVAKEAFGLAGSNAIRLWEPELLETQKRWLAAALENDRQIVIEPWLEREVDFSVQFEMGSDGLKPIGYTGLLNDRKGQFQANWAAPDFARRPPARVVDCFPSITNAAGQLCRLYADIRTRLEAELKRVGYLGPLGIDAFVYRTPQGDCRLKPVVEINPRYTMGRLTLELMQRTCPGSHGLFRLVNRAMLRTEAMPDFPAYARQLTERSPLRLEGSPVARIREGALCLNDPAEAQVCLAVFQVSRTG
jgi:uncharacterized ferritin-like protein (DUF455 family)